MEDAISSPSPSGSNTTPTDCPFPASTLLRGSTLTGRYATYTNADTWYPSWAADGALYSPWTDGSVNQWAVNSFGPLAATGTAKILGEDPLNLQVIPMGTRFAGATPYGGRYPSANLVLDGNWYVGTYCLDMSPDAENWDILGPFVGWRVSSDLGASWTDCPQTPRRPLFAESGKDGGKVRFGSPHVVDHGQEQQHSPDGLTYLVAHGGTASDADLSWITGDAAYLTRIRATPESINDPAAYEFYAGADPSGQPRWSTNLEDSQPIIEWQHRIGCVTATWIPALKRYLLCASSGWPTTGTTDTFLLEAPTLTGPWSLVSYWPTFGPQAYFANIPSKFAADDASSVWLCYSANYTNEWHDKSVPESPEGSRYALCLQELRLDRME